eukprot:SAG31_NODE_87_length_26728_cov_40.161591_1_plen_320_part_10
MRGLSSLSTERCEAVLLKAIGTRTSTSRLAVLRLNGCYHLVLSAAEQRDALLQHKQLVVLDLSNCPRLSRQLWQELLWRLTRLRRLNLCGCRTLGNTELCSMLSERAPWSSVMTNMHGTANAQAAGADSAAPNLLELDVSTCDLEDTAVSAIARRCRQLRSLSLAACDKLTSSSAHHLAKHGTELRSLDLSSTATDDAGVVQLLLSFTQLLRLKLFDCPRVSSVPFEACLAHRTSLLDVNLGGTAASKRLTRSAMVDVVPSLVAYNGRLRISKKGASLALEAACSAPTRGRCTLLTTAHCNVKQPLYHCLTCSIVGQAVV